MKIAKYKRITENYLKAKKDYENMFFDLQIDTRNSKLKVTAIAEMLGLKIGRLQYYFRTKNMPEKLLKKLLKILEKN